MAPRVTVGELLDESRRMLREILRAQVGLVLDDLEDGGEVSPETWADFDALEANAADIVRVISAVLRRHGFDPGEGDEPDPGLRRFCRVAGVTQRRAVRFLCAVDRRAA
jgi:hypothetical protein